MKIPVQFNKNLLKSLLTAFSMTLFLIVIYGYNIKILFGSFISVLFVSLTATNSIDLIFYMVEKRREWKEISKKFLKR